MSLPRAGALAAILFTLPACIYDGMYVVQGTVRSGSNDALRPLSGAAVATRDGRAGEPRKTVETEEDGTYRTDYRFGGMGFLLFTPGAGDPYVEFTAPGHQPRTVRLQAEKAEAGVTRRACDQQAPLRCFELDVVLLPEPATPPTHEDGA